MLATKTRPPNLKQYAAMTDETRHRFILAGRRGGKTSLLIEDILKSVPMCPPKGELFYIGPTNQDAKDIVWEPIQDRLDELGWKYYPKISKQRFEFSGGRKIYVIGAEKIRRIRGHKAFKAYLDELAFFSTDLGTVWKAVRPALSDLGGRAIAATTPNGKGTEAYDFYLQIRDKEEWAYHHWNTSDNPIIPLEELESARRELDEKSYRQEYEASWESYEGLAYYAFDENLHIKNCKEMDWDMQTGITLDFNVNPTTLLVTQQAKGKHYFRREYSQANSSTVDTAKSFCQDFKEHKDKMVITIYGDATGQSRRSNTGYSDYFYLKDVLTNEGFRFKMCVPGVNPPIVDRVAYVNSFLQNYYGESSVEVDPGCTDTIRDLSSQVLDGRFPSDKNNLGHKGDAFGYYVSWNHIRNSRKPQATVQL